MSDLEDNLAQQIKLRIPYPGAVISVNHYKYPGGRHTRPEASQWMENLAMMVRAAQHRQVTPPVHIRLSGHFRDWRSTPDLHNLHKVIGDALQQAFWVDDRNFFFEDGEITVGADDPYLVLEIN